MINRIPEPAKLGLEGINIQETEDTHEPNVIDKGNMIEEVEEAQGISYSSPLEIRVTLRLSKRKLNYLSESIDTLKTLMSCSCI
jgi:hypothetical protein